MGYLTFLSPYLIFVMLFITYCRVSFKEIRLTKFQGILLSVQLLLSVAVYLALAWWNPIVAEGVFICIFVPTATAAPVVTSMLGGSISKVAAYSLFCNLSIAVLGPVLLAAIGDKADYTFNESFLLILRQVAPLLLGPLLCAQVLGWFFPKAKEYIRGQQQLSFYLWAFALVIIVGSCVSFAIKTWRPENTLPMIWLALGALAACLLQFVIGRWIGRRYADDPVAGGQGLMQKNTVLAVWMAMAYMNPIASIAPAAYIAWQNIINSIQIARHKEN